MAKGTKYVEVKEGQTVVIMVGSDRVVSVRQSTAGAVSVTILRDLQVVSVLNLRNQRKS